MITRLLLTLTLILPALGCGPRDRGLELQDAVRAYNQRLRWSAFDQASAFVAAEKRAAWLASRTANATGLHFTDVQVIRLGNPDPGTKSVDVLVALSWYRMPDTRVHSATWAQTWQEIEGRWRLTDEKAVEVPPAPPPAEQWP